MVCGGPCQFFSRMGLLIKVTIDLTDMAETDPKPNCKNKTQGGNICATVGCSNTRYNSSVSLFRFPKEKKRKIFITYEIHFSLHIYQKPSHLQIASLNHKSWKLL